MILLLWLMPYFAILSPENHRLVKTKISDDISVSLPKELRPMAEEDIALRYPSVRQPIGAFTDNNREIDFSVSQSATQWYPDDVEMAQGFFKTSLYNLYDRLEMVDEGIHEIKAKKFIYFEFESRINGSRYDQGNQDSVLRYTYIQYHLQKGRTIVITFSCPKPLRGEWQETARSIMTSVKIK
ncbi:MAG: hypothetical protein RIB47_16035 [Cyclobacteriaceae bacterium]